MVQVEPDARTRGEPRSYGRERFPQMERMEQELKTKQELTNMKQELTNMKQELTNMKQELTMMDQWFIKMKQRLNKMKQEFNTLKSSPSDEVQPPHSPPDEIRKDKTVRLKNRGSQKLVTKRSWSATNIFVPFMLLLLMRPSRATIVHENLQHNLSDACYTELYQNGGDCPSVKHPDFKERYVKLNNTCCETFHGKDVHCQMNYNKDDNQFSNIACLVSVLVKKGYTGHIEFPNNTDPYFKVTPLDDSRYRGEGPRMSYEVTYPYGTVLKSDKTEITNPHGTAEKNTTEITTTTPGPRVPPERAGTRKPPEEEPDSVSSDVYVELASVLIVVFAIPVGLLIWFCLQRKQSPCILLTKAYF